jgi:hypothetical protein
MKSDRLMSKLGKLSVAQLESYLSNNDWSNEGVLRDVAHIWHRRDSDIAEVIVPLHERLRDYPERLTDALCAVASFEGRKPDDVLNDVLGLSSNYVTVRVIHEDTAQGTIPIQDGVLLVQRARDLLQSAAYSIYSKRRHFSGPLPSDARTYLDSLLLGQTEVGSYVVNVIAPVQSTQDRRMGDMNVLPDSESASFGAVVTTNLTLSLATLYEAVEDYSVNNDITVFDKAVFDGASANMCDALLGFSGIDRKRSFEIKIEAVATPLFPAEKRAFLFDAIAVTGLGKASEYFKDNYVLHDQTIIGFIKRLDRTQGDQFGRVTVSATVNGADKNVVIELEGSDYNDAILAHRDGVVVQCKGDIHVAPRTTRLLFPTDFRVLRSPDLFSDN